MESARRGGGSEAARTLRGTCAAAVGLALLSGCGGGGTAEPPTGGGGSGPASPDLRVQSLDFSPSGVLAGDSIHVIDSVHNDGTGDANGFQVAIYLSADALIDGGDTLIGIRAIGALASGHSSTGSGFLTVPPDLQEGTWFLGAIADVQGALAESDESNNVLVAVQVLEITTEPLPDLAPAHLAFTLSVVDAGEQIEVTDHVENRGEGDSGSFQVGIYLSPDPVITKGDELIGVRSVPQLSSGALSMMTAPLTVPAATIAGSWYVGALADLGGAEAESDEFNNTLVAAGTLQVNRPPRPDLVMNALEFSPFLVDAGQSITVSEEVLNQGLLAAGPFRVGIYLSEDGTVTTGDHLIGFRSLAGLDIGQTSSAAAPLVVPSDVGGGFFHVGAVADHEEHVVEEDEENNAVIALGVLEVVVPPMPDVLPVAVGFSPSVVTDGDLISVVELIVNQGVVDAESFRVSIYLSPNPIVTTSDVLLGSRTISSLAVGAEDEAAGAYPLPPGISSGSWTLGVIADDLDVLPEPDEGNNLLVASGHIDITTSSDPLPDLFVEELSISPAMVLEEGQLTILSTVRNQGELSAGQFQTGFYFSEDETIDKGDHLIGVRNIYGLGIDHGSAQSRVYTLDGSLPVGIYHFGAICDDTQMVEESDEDNNLLKTAGTIEIYVPPPPAPDLVVTTVTFDPASAKPGESLQIDNTVRNAGNLAAEYFHVDFYLSEDETIETDDTFLGSGLSVPSLDSGAESSASTQIDIPVDLATGTYHVGAIVAVDSGPAESNEENNTKAASSTLEVIE